MGGLLGILVVSMCCIHMQCYYTSFISQMFFLHSLPRSSSINPVTNNSPPSREQAGEFPVGGGRHVWLSRSLADVWPGMGVKGWGRCGGSGQLSRGLGGNTAHESIAKLGRDQAARSPRHPVLPGRQD